MDHSFSGTVKGVQTVLGRVRLQGLREAYVSEDRERRATAGLTPKLRMGVWTLGSAALGRRRAPFPGKPPAVWTGPQGKETEGHFAAVSPLTLNFILLFS